MFIHIDLDCYFVSAHRVFDKSLHNIPVAVGGKSNSDIFSLSSNKNISSKEFYTDENGKIRGIITTASYEARKFGVKTTMSVNEALKICPNLKLIVPDYKLYSSLSKELKKLLEDEIPLIEQYSIDEFFGDLTGYISEDEAYLFAQKLKDKIYSTLQLPCSIGLASGKYLAKLMTEFAKPNGIKLLKKDEIEKQTDDIAIYKFTGIGNSFVEKLKGYNINTLADIRKNKALFYSFGKNSIDLYNRVCGINDNQLIANKERKSIGIGRSFDVIYNREEIRRRVLILARYLSFKIKKDGINPKSFIVKIRYEYGIKAQNQLNTNSIFNEFDFKNSMLKLFDKSDIHKSHGIIQLYITAFNFAKQNEQIYDLFNYESDLKKDRLDRTILSLREKFGVDIIKNATEVRKILK